jgi:hypothetical protein
LLRRALPFLARDFLFSTGGGVFCFDCRTGPLAVGAVRNFEFLLHAAEA